MTGSNPCANWHNRRKQHTPLDQGLRTVAKANRHQLNKLAADVTARVCAAMTGSEGADPSYLQWPEPWRLSPLRSRHSATLVQDHCQGGCGVMDAAAIGSHRPNGRSPHAYRRSEAFVRVECQTGADA